MLDRIWAQWQALSESNVYDIAGFVDTELEPLSGYRNTSAYFPVESSFF